MTRKSNPWYKERLVWLLISLPAAAVVGGIATMLIAVNSADSLVADDYYKQGMAINKTLERDELARSLGLEADVRLADGRAVIVLRSASGSLPDRLRLTLVHPTQARQDESIPMERKGEGTFVGPIGGLGLGRWQVRLEDEPGTWRMIGTVQIPEQTTVHLSGGNAGT